MIYMLASGLYLCRLGVIYSGSNFLGYIVVILYTQFHYNHCGYFKSPWVRFLYNPILKF